MARKWLMACLLGVAVWQGAAARDEALEQVSWCSFDLPPMYIGSGPDAGTGTVDRQAAFMMAHLPQYAHRFYLSNIRRLEEQVRAEHRAVCAGMQKNAERETFMLFSAAFQATPAPTIVLPRKLLPAIVPFQGPDGAVNLQALLERGELRLGVAFGRSYGRSVDELLAAHKGQPHVIERSASQRMSEGLLQMVTLGRIDYTILFSGERKALLDLADASTADFVSLSIRGLPRYNTVHFVAPRNEWGRVFIARVDAVLQKHWLDRSFRADLYALPESERKEALALLREIEPARQAGKRGAGRD